MNSVLTFGAEGLRGQALGADVVLRVDAAEGAEVDALLRLREDARCAEKRAAGDHLGGGEREVAA
jgi:hypothetical protein